MNELINKAEKLKHDITDFTIISGLESYSTQQQIYHKQILISACEDLLKYLNEFNSNE